MEISKNARNSIIVALDVDTLEEARKLVKALTGVVGMFKIGYRLGAAVGWPQAIRCVCESGQEVFLDAKLNDTPDTVAAAVRNFASQGVSMVSIHASAGIEAMQCAVMHRGKAKILAVTVLTSLSPRDAARSFGDPHAKKTMYFAQDACNSGVDGIIGSAVELGEIALFPKLSRLTRVAVGIRPAGYPAHDQRRISTPKQAVIDGAHYIVIGRPITHPHKRVGGPRDAAEKILEEITPILREDKR